MSFNTTELGPLVSVGNPVLSDPSTTPVLHMDGATLDASEGALLSAQTTSTLTAGQLQDGELLIDQVSAATITLTVRSGETLYSVNLT